MDPGETSGAAPKSDFQAVAGVQLKLPPYWPNDPELWFTQVEAQLITRGITVEKTKYEYIVSSLQSEYAQEVRDSLLSTPTSDPYTHLKSELIKRTSASEQKRLHQLLTAEELGDRKPTQLLRRMEQLLGGAKLESSIFTQLFLQRLPHHVQSSDQWSYITLITLISLKPRPYPCVKTHQYQLNLIINHNVH